MITIKIGNIHRASWKSSSHGTMSAPANGVPSMSAVATSTELLAIKLTSLREKSRLLKNSFRNTFPLIMAMVNGPSIVITGIGGRYPESMNVDEFWTNLLSGRQLYTADDRRWPLGYMNLPLNAGKTPSVERFDAKFFNMSNHEADEMDPQFKICHEITFEAIVDAGLDPCLLANDRTGMFVGYCYSDAWSAQTEDASTYDCHWTETFSEVSKFFGFKGPCSTFDSACASSFSALNEAFHAIKAGVIDTAIVAGVAFSSHPYIASNFRQLGMTSEDGISRCMDRDAKGYVRSETMCSIVVQRHEHGSAPPVKRIYGTILNCKSNSDGFKKEGITYPGKDSMIRLMRETFDGVHPDVHIDPAKDVKYIEAHVTSTQVGDPVECNAIEAVFCTPERKEPLLVGCLKSNMGHAEGASGVAAITKACLILQRKMIPPNIGYQNPNPNIPGLMEGKLKPVLEPMTFNDGRSVISLNSFGFGGTNIHAIVKSFDDELNADVHNLAGYKGINRLILFKGRTEQSFEALKRKIMNDPNDVTTEYLDLVNNLANLDDEQWNLPFRGYFILDKDSKRIIKSVWRPSKLPGTVSMTVKVKYPLDIDACHLRNMIDVLLKAGIQVVASHVRDGDHDSCSVIISSSSSKDGSKKWETLQKTYQLTRADDVLSLIGDQYMIGVQDMKLENLYPKIKYPVSRSTASTSPLNSWNHEKEWRVYKAPEYFRVPSNKRFHFDYSGTFNFLSGHKIDGRILFPASGYLWTVWQSISLDLVENTHFAYLKTKVTFWNVSLHQALIVDDLKTELSFMTTVDTVTGRFQVTKDGTLLVDGRVAIDHDSWDYGSITKTMTTTEPVTEDGDHQRCLSKKDFYKELRVRGYDYEDDFQGVEEVNFDGRKGSVSFLKHWICFADAVFQLSLIADNSRSLHIPVGFEQIQADGPTFKDITSADYRKYLTISDAVDTDNQDDNQDKVGKDANLDDNSKNVVQQFQVDFLRETTEIITTGLYVKGLKSTSTTRRVMAPIIRACNQWRPLDEVVAEDGINLVMKTDYQAKCLEVLMDIKNRNSLKSMANTGHGDDDFNAGHGLLKELISIREAKGGCGDGAEIRNQLIHRRHELSKDMLLTVPIEGDCMMHILTMITDVIGNKRIEITEFNLSLNDTLEPMIKPLVTGLFISSGYKSYNQNGIDGQHLDSFMESNVKVDSDMAIIQHPSLSFNFLNTKDGCIKNESLFHDVMDKVRTQLKEGSFMIVILRRGSYEIEDELNSGHGHEYENKRVIIDKMTQCSGLTLICIKQIGSYDLITFRNFSSCNSKKVDDCQPLPLTLEISDANSFEWINQLKDVVKNDGKSCLDNGNNKIPIFLLIKRGPNGGDVHGMDGFVHCFKQEDDCIHLIDVSSSDGQGNGHDVELKDGIIEKCYEMRLRTTIIRNGTIGSNMHSMNMQNGHMVKSDTLNRYQSSVDMDKTAMCLNVGTKGDLSSLYYEIVPISSTRGTGSNIIDVHYGSLNFKDIMIATGRLSLSVYPDDYKDQNTGDIGIEYTGVDGEGRKVMGLTTSDAIATKVNVTSSTADFMYHVPDDMTLEEAATVPVVYMTVFYGLIMRGKLVNGESILIHAGSGGVGQAAINVCQSMKCDIFTTVGTVEKREFIKSTFNIPDDHIFDSRSISFADDLLRVTNGRGVDMVLNSLTEEKLQAGLNCLAVNGRFIEIGKYDFLANSMFDPSKLSSNQSFHSTCLAFFLAKCKGYRNEKNMEHPDVKILKGLMDKGLKNGSVKPLPRTIFKWDKVEEAFRFMATGKHIGKVIIDMNGAREHMAVNGSMVNEAHGKVVMMGPSTMALRVSFDGAKSYLVIGGLGGMGLQLCQWLVTKGVRVLIITSRTGVQSSYQKFCIEQMETGFGCKIFVRTENVSILEEAQNLINFCNQVAPVGGIFNLAMVLKDNLFVDQTIESFKECCDIKVAGSANLDKISRKSCPNLDHFVCFSSIASTIGNVGQSNYGYANSFMDNLCSSRRSDGLPGMAIAWGAVGDTGHVAENMGDGAIVKGTVPLRINSCMEVIERILNGHHANVCSYLFKDSSGFEVKGNILATIFNVLGIKDNSKVDPRSTLGNLGIDSLMAVEIKQIIQKKYEKNLTTKEIRDLTVEQIKSLDSVTATGNKDNLTTVSGIVESDVKLFSDRFNLAINVFEVLRNGDGKGSPIFIFPPLDGTFIDLEPLIEDLSKKLSSDGRPIVGVNWTKETFDLESVPSVASHYIDHLVANFPSLTTLDFVAYSIGSVVAIEVASQLKERGSCPQVGHLILLDGSPSFVKQYTSKVSVSGDASEKTWTTVVMEYFKTIGSYDWSSKITKFPENATSIKKWSSILTTIKKDDGTFITEQECIDAMERIRLKTFMSITYDPVNKLDMNVFLIRSKDEMTSDQIRDDYDLHTIFKGHISVSKYEGDHKTFLRYNSYQIADDIHNFLLSD